MVERGLRRQAGIGEDRYPAMRTLGRLVLALALALAAAGAHAQDEEPCPNPKGLKLSPEELQAKLQAHKKWAEEGSHYAAPGRAILCNVDLLDANLRGRQPVRGQPPGRRPERGQPPECLPGRGQPPGRRPGRGRCHQCPARLSTSRTPSMRRHRPRRTAMWQALLVSVGDHSHPGDIIGLVQLRKLLQEAGLPEERDATYAIERNKTRHLIFGEWMPRRGRTIG